MRIESKRIVSVGAAVSAAFLFSYPVSAATVVPLQGAVRVSTEDGFKRLDETSEVAPLSRVMVAPGGSATIVYTNNCQVRVTSFATVLAKPPCKGEFAKPSYLSAERPPISAADDDYGFTPKVGSRTRPRSADDDCVFDHHTLLVIGGVALAAGAALLLLNDGGEEGPASP